MKPTKQSHREAMRRFIGVYAYLCVIDMDDDAEQTIAQARDILGKEAREFGGYSDDEVDESGQYLVDKMASIRHALGIPETETIH